MLSWKVFLAAQVGNEQGQRLNEIHNYNLKILTTFYPAYSYGDHWQFRALAEIPIALQLFLEALGNICASSGLFQPLASVQRTKVSPLDHARLFCRVGENTHKADH